MKNLIGVSKNAYNYVRDAGYNGMTSKELCEVYPEIGNASSTLCKLYQANHLTRVKQDGTLRYYCKEVGIGDTYEDNPKANGKPYQLIVRYELVMADGKRLMLTEEQAKQFGAK